MFYENLYEAQKEAQVINKLEAIFKKRKLDKLSQSEADELTAPIQDREIKDVINSLKNKKCPGSDGLPGELYKTFMKELTPKLCQVFNYSLQENAPPKICSESIITAKTLQTVETLDHLAYWGLTSELLVLYWREGSKNTNVNCSTRTKQVLLQAIKEKIT